MSASNLVATVTEEASVVDDNNNPSAGLTATKKQQLSCPRVSRDLIFGALQPDDVRALLDVARQLPKPTDARGRIRTAALHHAVATRADWIDAVRRAQAAQMYQRWCAGDE